MSRTACLLRVIGATLRLSIVVGAPACLAASSARYDWSTADLSFFGGIAKMPQATASRALCGRVIGLRPSPGERPSAVQAVALRGCNSEALLYGIGRPADPAAARRCAWLEYDRQPDADLPYFSGPGILAVTYANGWGGPRDLDMAIHMACGIDDAPAAMEARLADLQSRAAGKGEAKPFALCDDQTSGRSAGVCASHRAALADQDRDRMMASWTRGWPPARKAAFERVRASMAAYAEAAHALDCRGGTLAAACSIDGVQDDGKRFVQKIGALLGRNPPPPIPALDDRANAATDADWWRRRMEDVPDPQKPFYAENGRRTVAARAQFERDLLAFAQTIPGVRPHQVRALFSDL